MRQQRLAELRLIAQGLRKEGRGYWGIYFSTEIQKQLRTCYAYFCTVQECKQVIEEESNVQAI